MQALLRIIGATVVALALSAGGAVQAADIVVPGSTYNFAIRGYVPNPAYPSVPNAPPGLEVLTFEATGVRFDGLTDTFDNSTNQTFLLDDTRTSPKTVTLTESQSDLGNGRFQIAISFRVTAGNLFPHTTEWFMESIGLADGNDPLDFVGGAHVHVDSAVQTLRWAPNGAFGTDWAAWNPQPFPSPWDGRFLNARGGAGFTGVGYMVVQGVDVVFTVSLLDAPVSEPAPIALACLGAGLGLAARRRRVTTTAIGAA